MTAISLIDWMMHPRFHMPMVPRVWLSISFAVAFWGVPAPRIHGAPIVIDGRPVEIAVRAAGGKAVRVTVRPIDSTREFPDNPALARMVDPKPVIRIRETGQPVTAAAGGLRIDVRTDPVRIGVRAADGALVQELDLRDDGGVGFRLDEHPVLGLGGGGPRPAKGADWRKAPVEFDRRGRFHAMEPRWQTDAYGSRNPVALLAGTGGWGLYFASPWGKFDLTEKGAGVFIPVERKAPAAMRQTFANQREQLGKGIPPMETLVPGLLDVFVFDARDPAAFMKDIATIVGRAVLPPKWALGYMQSHRTLETDAEMLGIVDTFREKRIPLDAVIYLGTGFTPRGWNKKQPSFEFNPEVFKRDPAKVIGDLHQRNVKVVLHMVPWDRDRLPYLDDSSIAGYWKEHAALAEDGVDGWWPDEGDWFDLHERLARHKLYHEGPLSTRPERRPWSLHRNGHLGIARWGGWIWSGDTESTWKSLEAQIAVGINSSLSLSPYWGSDIGGFFSTGELTGELYARWFQFGAFCPSFRSHGRTWWTRLPWGWGLDTLGPVEDGRPPDRSALNDPEIEKIARKFAELRYRLLPYNYTLAWEARETGMPFMRSLWLHHPEDEKARGIGTEYLWGRDLLIAPVFEKGARSREVHLPRGGWYDWWTGERLSGGRAVHRKVDLATMPIFARAGSIIPLDPVRQYTAEPVSAPTTLLVHPGADGAFTLYEDEGDGPGYRNGASATIPLRWDDARGVLTIGARAGNFPGMPAGRVFRVVRAGNAADGEREVEVKYDGGEVRVSAPPERHGP